jgi:hypothetical protein
MNADQKKVDVFLYRLLGAIGTALGAILAGYSTYLSMHRIPGVESLLADFGARVPALTSFILRAPWLPMAVSWLAVGVGVLAIVSIHRAALASCWLLAVLSLALVLLTQYALELPMQELMHALRSV